MKITYHKNYVTLECECGNLIKFNKIPKSYHCDKCKRAFEQRLTPKKGKK